MGNKIVVIFGAVIVAFILFMGVFLLVSDLFIDKIPKPNRTYLGVVFIIYGAYRAYRIYNVFKNSHENE